MNSIIEFGKVGFGKEGKLENEQNSLRREKEREPTTTTKNPKGDLVIILVSSLYGNWTEDRLRHDANELRRVRRKTCD